jgi:hypothetical protein
MDIEGIIDFGVVTVKRVTLSMADGLVFILAKLAKLY